MVATVVQYPGVSLMDMPGRLRELAQDIEQGLVDAKSVVVVIELDRDVETRAFGECCDTVRATGLMQAAIIRTLQRG